MFHKFSAMPTLSNAACARSPFGQRQDSPYVSTTSGGSRTLKLVKDQRHMTAAGYSVSSTTSNHKCVVHGSTLRTPQLPQPSSRRRSLSTLSSRSQPSHFRHLWNLYRCCLKWSFLANVRSATERSAHATNSCESKCF